VIKVGQVVGAFGTAGAVKVETLTDFEDRFAVGADFHVEGVVRSVEWSRSRPSGLVLKLSGIDSRTAASGLRGAYLEVPPGRERELPAGRYYHHQLVGLEVRTQEGGVVGKIADVLSRPANDVWVVRSGQIERLIPATRDAVIEVDLDAGRVVIAGWLLTAEDA
jgi:16S rRNA processing protein RimM